MWRCSREPYHRVPHQVPAPGAHRGCPSRGSRGGEEAYEESRIAPCSMRARMKSLLIDGYCHGYLPARFVAWAFRVFDLGAV